MEDKNRIFTKRIQANRIFSWNSLSLDIQSQFSNSIAGVIISTDDRDKKFVLNDQVDLPDSLSMCIVGTRGETLFATANGEWLRGVSVDGVGKTAYRNDA